MTAAIEVPLNVAEQVKQQKWTMVDTSTAVLLKVKLSAQQRNESSIAQRFLR